MDRGRFHVQHPAPGDPPATDARARPAPVAVTWLGLASSRGSCKDGSCGMLLGRCLAGRPTASLTQFLEVTVPTASGPLRRSRSNRMIAGVVGGLADHFGIDPTLARVLYVVGSVV